MTPNTSSPPEPGSWLTPRDPVRATLALIVVTALIRVGLAVLMDYGNGESYYLATARELQLSYFDQPPLFLWIGWAMLHLTGSDDPAVIRLPFIALFAGTTWMLFTLTRRLYSARAGFYAALLLNISAVFTISVGGWFQPDGPLMLFWLLTAWALARILLDPSDGGTKAWGWWLVAGLFLGLTLLSKYHAVFLVAGAGLFVLIRADQRPWLRHPAPYVAVGLALLVASPVLIWNAQNEWVSFAFQGGRSVESAGLRPEWLLRSLIGQMTWLLPWVWLPMIWVFARALVRGPKAPSDWFLACLAVGPVAFFTIVALWAPLGFHFHWQAPGYLMLFPLLGRLADGGLARRPRLTGTWLNGSVAVTALVIAVLGSHIATNWIARVVPLDKDPTLEALEWRALRDDLKAEGLLDRPNTFAAAVHWVEGGKVDSAVGGALPVVVLSDDPRNLAFTFDLTQAEGWDVLLMGTDRRLKDPAARFSQTFRGDIDLIGRYNLTRGGDVVIEDIGVFLAHGFTVRHDIRFDGSDPESYFGAGWGPTDATADGRDIAGESAVLHIDVEPLVRYGDLTLRARSTTGQQTLSVTWEGRPAGRLVLPEDGSPVELNVSVPSERRVGRRQATLTLTPDQTGVAVEALNLAPKDGPDS
ncbi:glycosyltransferase family 39 protein [uncultured Rhodospira sp.]|uniref:ArnT family glycosyltransferase n=1 Tax=uncultured Rhodospira sp. TaxID=1936189 RepID=UPI0026186936|nr:glycosyltransferase family 39 protein [uncultured Rhodospira sp.]